METTAGSVSSTKQFIWCGDDGRCEERNASGSITKNFLGNLGQTISGTNYFYLGDHNDSVSEMVNSSGVVQTQYRFDPYGRAVKIQGSLDSDFQFDGMYYHARSGLNLAVYRAYSSNMGRWINRDPIEESGGVNLFAFAGNAPSENVDPDGLALILIWPRPLPIPSNPSCGWNPPARPPGRPPKNNGRGGGGGGGDPPVTPPKKPDNDDDDIGPSGGGGGGRGPRYDDPQRGKGRAGKGSGKARSSNVPGWVKRDYQRLPGENAHDFAKRILDDKYGKGNWPKGSGSEYNQIVKWVDREDASP